MATQERMITVAELTLMKERRDALRDALAYWVEYVETSTMPETVALKGWLGKARDALDAIREMKGE